MNMDPQHWFHRTYHLKVRLQELEEKEKGGGRVPRTIDIELLEDVCDTCVPGDVVTVTGVVKVRILYLVLLLAPLSLLLYNVSLV